MNSLFLSRRTAAAISSLMICAAFLSGCGSRVTPLNEVVFGSSPLTQIKDEIQTFRQLNDDDLKTLLTYVAVNEKARLEGNQYSPITGKSLTVVIQEMRVWQASMSKVLEQGRQMAQALAKQIVVVPFSKSIEEADPAIGKASIVRISYMVNNRTSRTINGLKGNIRYLWPDGTQAAVIALSFEETIAPNSSLTLYGHEPILVRSNASEDMVAFANLPIDKLRWEFLPSAVRYDNNQIYRLPSF